MSQFAVIDPSVSLKWALDDEDQVNEAELLLNTAIDGQFEMVAPFLWYYEVTNALVAAVRRKRLDKEEGERKLSLLLALRMRFVDPDSTNVYEQSLHYRVAAYDAAFLVLAEALDAPLWTGDRHFYEAVRDSASFVHWIGDYK